MGGGGHGGPEAVALLPVAGLPGFRGDPPEWSYQQVKGSSDASNDDPFASEPPTGKKWVQTGPHVMIGGPGIVKMLDSYPATADDTRKPYVMFGGTPYDHLMVPVR